MFIYEVPKTLLLQNHNNSCVHKRAQLFLSRNAVNDCDRFDMERSKQKAENFLNLLIDLIKKNFNKEISEIINSI